MVGGVILSGRFDDLLGKTILRITTRLEAVPTLMYKEADLDKKLDKLSSSPLEVLVVNMFDNGIDNRELAEKYGGQHIVNLVHELLGQQHMVYSLGYNRVTKYVEESKQDPITFAQSVKMGHPDLIIVSGKYSSFQSQGDGTYRMGEHDDDGKVFREICRLIQETDIPTLAICAGHQHVGITYGGHLGYVYDPNENGDRRRVEGELDTQTIVYPAHPLFTGLANTDKMLHHVNEEYVMLNGSENIRVMARQNANGIAIPNITEVYDPTRPGKHIITFQCHPERIDKDLIHGLREKIMRHDPNLPNAAGLTLLINAMYLLTHTNYTKAKQLFWRQPIHSNVSAINTLLNDY